MATASRAVTASASNKGVDISLAEAALYALDRFALAILIGCGATALWLIGGEHQQRAVMPGLRRLAAVALLLMTITTAATLIFRTATLADTALTETGPYLFQVISDSAFGTLWMIRVALLTVMAVAWAMWRSSSGRAALLMVAGAALTAFCISGASHAGDEGLFTLDNLNNSFHILAGCLWGGAIIAFIVLLKRVRCRLDDQLANSAARLSTLATVALATVLATGLINAINRFETLAQLWESGYGITLLIKLGFVAVMMTIGAINRFHIVPALIRFERGASRRLMRALYADALIFVIVVSCAAALAMQSPVE